jgi:hypothetical protein
MTTSLKGIVSNDSYKAYEKAFPWLLTEWRVIGATFVDSDWYLTWATTRPGCTSEA